MTRVSLAGLGCLALVVACGSEEFRPVDAASTSGTGGSSSATGGSASNGGTGGAGGSPTECEALTAELQQALDAGRAAANSPGASAAVITPACGRWLGVSGQSTVDDPVRPEYALHMASVTKTFVTAAVLLAASDGLLDLDEPIASWFPDVPGGDAIVVRQLLNHTSGIFNYTDDPGWQAGITADPLRVWTPQELVDAALAHPPDFAPGRGFNYSNTGFVLAGMIVEAVTGQGIAEVVRTRLLEPTELASTFFAGEEPIGAPMAHGYSGSYDLTGAVDPSGAWAAGAMVATPGDLALWAVSLYAGAVLDPDSSTAMQQTVDTGVAGLRYGLGMVEYDPAVLGSRAIGHLGGAYFGYRTHMLYFPDLESVIVSMTNDNNAEATDITTGLLAVLLDGG